MSRAVKLWPAVLAGGLLGLSFPPIGARLLVFVALALWLRQLPGLSPRGSFWSGYALGFVFYLSQLHWLVVLATRWTGSFGLGFFPYLLACMLGAFYFSFAGWILGKCYRSGREWMAPFAWAGIEIFRSYIPVLAFPYSLLASPLWPYPALTQSARFGSIYLVGASIFVVNMAVARLADKRRPRGWQLAAAGGVFLLGFAAYVRPLPVRQVVVAAGQTGIDMAFDPYADAKVPDAAAELALDAEKANVQLLVLPEGLPSHIPLPDTDIPIVAGAQRPSKTRPDVVYQSAILHEDGQVVAHADKTRLVIFGEFVPGRDWIPFLSSFHLPSGDLAAGSRVTSMDTPIGRVGPILCFEALFPDIAYRQATNGSDLLAVLSIDDWYMGTGAPEQLEGATTFRAIETGLPAVRAASLGYSLIADSRGRLIAQAPLGERRLLTARIGLPDHPIAPLWLPVFPLASLLVLISLVLEALFVPGRKHANGVNSDSANRQGMERVVGIV